MSKCKIYSAIKLALVQNTFFTQRQGPNPFNLLVLSNIATCRATACRLVARMVQTRLDRSISLQLPIACSLVACCIAMRSATARRVLRISIRRQRKLHEQHSIKTTTRQERWNGFIGRGKGRHRTLSMLARCLGTGAPLLPRLQLCRPLPLSATAGYDL